MKGSIRVFVGLLITAGAVGGMEVGTDPQLPLQLFTALVGLLVMFSGVSAIKKEAK